MNQTSFSGLQPFLRPWAAWLLSVAPLAGARSVHVTSVKRSRAQQAALYKSYLAGRSQFPAAPPGRSKHELGLAFDIVTVPFAALYTLGSWWRSLDGEWSSKDPIHFAARSGSAAPPAASDAVRTPLGTISFNTFLERYRNLGRF